MSRIGLDARMYGPQQGGLGRYIQQLIVHLEQLETTDEFVIFLRKENWDEYTPANPRFKKILAEIPWYGWKEQLQFPGIIKKEKIDLMHFPHWNVPIFYNDPFVVTIHDLLLLHFPTKSASTLGPLSYWFKNQAYKLVLRHAVIKAKHIVAVSEYTKEDLHKTLGIPLGKITTTYQAPSKNFQFPIPPAASGIPLRRDNFQANPNAQNIKNNLSPFPFPLSPRSITKPYALYVGVAYPHKNLEGLLRAWKIFQEKYGHDYQLVLAGKKNYFYNRLKSSVFDLQSSNVIFTDFIPDSELPDLYQNASLYVMPSLYEGFALPSLEAMLYNLPVASSNATCLPEVLGSAALYFDPKNDNEMAEVIHEGLTNNPLRQALATEGKKVVARYSAKKLAETTYQIYRKSL